MTREETYTIRRVFFDESKPDAIIKTRQTLEQAQAHCQRPDTSGDGPHGPWMDTYTSEPRPKPVGMSDLAHRLHRERTST